MEMMKVTEILRNNGLKVTPQRLAVYQVLDSCNNHPNAETIYDSLREKYPTMSLATVYKSLDVMVKVGLIKQINLGEDSFRYDSRLFSHPHVCCTKCGKIVDAYDVSDNGLVDSIAKKTSFVISGHQFYFYGICPECQNNL